MNKHLSKLLGGTITEIVCDDFDETLEEYGEPLYALIVTMPSGKQLQVTILQDPEGNGAGFLDIIELK